MSLKDGIAAINLEMPPRVPRTEYSAEWHWALINRVCGTTAGALSSPAEREKATLAFRKAWNYDFLWNVCINNNALGKYYTDMGHANYASGNVDFRLVGESLFKDEDDVLNFDPMESLGAKQESELVNFFNEDYKRISEQNPDLVNMTGIYITCISGLIDLFGWDLLLTAAGVNPAGFGETANRYVGWVSQYFNALAKSEAPVVMIHDDIVWTSGAFVSPGWYRKYVFPNYKKLFMPLREAGKRIIYTSDGNYTEFIDDIADCGINGFVMEPVTDMRYIAERYGKTHVFIGNADTRILLSGSRDDIYNEVKRCMDIGKGYPGFFMAVGNHIPANTPVDNVLWYNECYEKLSRR